MVVDTPPCRKHQNNRGKPYLVRAPPRVLYHGTNLRYLHHCARHYMNYIPGKIWLTDKLTQAISTAFERASQYKSKPLVLIIDTEKLKKPLVNDKGGTWFANELSPDSFNLSIVKSTYEAWSNDILRLSHLLPQLTPEEAKEDNANIFPIYS